MIRLFYILLIISIVIVVYSLYSIVTNSADMRAYILLLISGLCSFIVSVVAIMRAKRQ